MLLQGGLPQIKDDVSVVNSALTKAQKFFATGKTKPIAFRIQQLRNLKKGLHTMNKDLTDAVQKDLGRDYFSTWFTELSLIDKEIDHTIEHLKQWNKGVCVDTPVFVGPARSRIVNEPLGVVCIMGSWNFPLYTTLAPLISAIAAGNCAIIKPSEIAPNTLLKVKSLIMRNLESNCYIGIEGQVEVAKALTNAKFDLICYTGSTEKGRLVAAAAGTNLVPCILELGGKCPAIVDENANLEFAAKQIARGKFLNAGQICIATDYVLLHYSVTDKFIRLLEKEIKVQTANGTNITDLGRVVNEFHVKRLQGLLKGHQGNVVIGNGSSDGEIQPTVILNPSRDSELMKTEIFGPILPIISFQKFDEVITSINQGDKPLAIYYFGAPWSGNLSRLESETSSGSLVTNDTLFQMANPNLPFGGVGASGHGRYHGYEGFKQFSNQKSILTKPALSSYPYNKVFPPFSKDKQGLIRFLVKYLSMTQKQLVKRFLWFLVFLWLVKLYLNGTISMKSYRKWKNIFNMAGNMLPMLMK